jgi:recombinational DNA repair ATPase RecF
MLEAEFIELKTGNTPLLLIDDFMSELDLSHRELLLQSFSKYQTIITNIEKIPLDSTCEIEM